MWACRITMGISQGGRDSKLWGIVIVVIEVNNTFKIVLTVHSCPNTLTDDHVLTDDHDIIIMIKHI